MAIHCLKANTLAICDNDNNENGNTASSGIGIVAFCGIIRYKIAAANRKIVLLLNDLFVAMVPPPFLLYFARPTHTILAVGVPIPYKYPPVEDDSGFLFFVIATLLIKTYSSFEDIVYRIILVAVRYFLGSK